MESGSLQQDSDEGVELSLQEEESDDLRSYTDNERGEESTILEADTIYVLLPRNLPVSRSSRFRWFLDLLNTVVTIPPHLKVDNSSNKLEIISAAPKKGVKTRTNRYIVTSKTCVKFLAHSYRFVYCFDMSPSQSAVNTEKNEILFEEIFTSFKATLEGLCNQFTIPGNSTIFQPNLYLTVIANTPFFMSPAQQVLVKGVKITCQNVQEIVSIVENQFHFLEGRIAKASSMAHDEIDLRKLSSEDVSTSPSLTDLEQNTPNIAMVLPDVNFVNMLRYSMLAILLLPENSLSHVLVITDGVVAMPDSNIMESLLLQLHYESISVSFLKVGPKFHAGNSAGFVSYTDLLHFLSQATSGVCLEDFDEIKPCSTMLMNKYHESYLLWTFHSKSKYSYSPLTKWKIPNGNFHNHRIPVLLCKKQTEDNVTASVSLLLSRRMREGYNVDYVKFDNGLLEVSLSVEWKSYIYIQYHITYQWPMLKNVARVEVLVFAPYEFLHDITCLMKKESKSSYRQAVIERYWLRITQLSADNVLAQQLTSIQNSNIWHTLPESVKSGIPVFILEGSDSPRLTLSPNDVTCSKFTSVWQPICQIECSTWRKWFHVHKLSVVLKYDHPLPKHLHLANSSGRFQVIQCRQAATALYSMLSEWSSFILIDNHTYLKFLYYHDDHHPAWFCIVRVIPKFPCAIINVAFVTGTPGFIRHEVVENLKIELCNLSYLSSPIKSKENMCCTLLQKPLERILIRYERMPSDLTTIIFPDGTQPPNSLFNLPPSPVAGTLFTTLSRYLYHRRWIWSTSYSSNPKLEMTAISRILSTLTRMRLKEGFSFAHSSSGIITMVLELSMKPLSSCVIQYVLFPPHRAWREGEFTSGSEDEADPDSDLDPDLQMVTEVWIEPQYGVVQPRHFWTNYLDHKRYQELADVIRHVDSLCINSLLTLEHLNLICQNKIRAFSVDRLISSRRSSTVNKKRKSSARLDSRNSINDDVFTNCDTEERIEHIPFNFDPISILPLSQQTELLFSMFIESNERITSLNNYDYEKSNKFLLENIQDHLLCLHDYELDITSQESDRLTEQILVRHLNKYPHLCPISHTAITVNGASTTSEDKHVPQWRCFIKGISVTHVILTFVPTNLQSLKKLVAQEGTNSPSVNESSESTERASSRGSNFSDVPINATTSFALPLYVFDCPLGLLVKSYVNNYDDNESLKNDVYEDHRFKFGTIIQEDSIRLKDDGLNGSPEPKSDESDVNDSKNNVKQHCRALVLAHSKCFVMSLFSALQHGAFVHRSDVQSAMDQCEENVYDIDISYYLQTICGHLKQQNNERIDVQVLHQPTHCIELRPFHRLIKEKFFEIINVAFSPIPTNREYYYCRNLILDKMVIKGDSDDEVSIPPSDGIEFRCDKEAPGFSDFAPYLLHLDSTSSRGSNQCITPLFVHLICTVRYNNHVANTSVKVLPTCIGELMQNIELDSQYLKKSKLQISLDIMCLTLPLEVQNVMNDYSSKGLRTTSFCSDGFQTSVGSVTSDASYIPEFSDPLLHLPEVQRKAITNLQEEIKWLLKDEIATALLDCESVNSNILNFVINHVSESSSYSSCIKDIIDLNFVYGVNQSYDKFLQEFSEIKLPQYKLLKEDELYYISKSSNYKPLLTTNEVESYIESLHDSVSDKSDDNKIIDENEEIFLRNEVFSQKSDLSSIGDSYVGTDGGYDEDVSEDEEDFNWLLQLDNKRKTLPNFWLIMQVDQDAVTIYFHCRFLELPTTLIGTYLQVQRGIRDAIKSLCKKVNQSLLLQALNDTRQCHDLLESEDTFKDWNSDNNGTPILTRNASFSRLKSMDETSDDADLYPMALVEASFKFKPGFFSCPVVWETQFVLHPRLKTGSGKFSLSRGVVALKTVLDKFSVTNRNNMFVYQDVNSSVFYLRLHENLQNFPKGGKHKGNEFEHTIVSRSPSIASLPLGPQKSILTQSQQSIASSNSRESDIRPRVRSFGEKEIKDNPHDDTLIIKVHGITEVGDDVRCELVQVLQNRLDDAVLECLSVMLARNVMCPLTPEDVHFLQRPFRLPEIVIRFTVQDFALTYLDSFIYYLKQNLLQFLNVPKYNDSRSHYHFKDYSESDQSSNKYSDNMFIYNQSQNPSSGNRGIACIALAVVVHPDQHNAKLDPNFDEMFKKHTFEEIIAFTKLDENDKPDKTFFEFRLWKQGRVNRENLFQKLYDATSQAMWDIATEYYLLKNPLCENDGDNYSRSSTSTNKLVNNESSLRPSDHPHSSKETECSVLLNTIIDENTRSTIRQKQEIRTKHFQVPKVLVSNRRHKKYIPINSSARRSILFDDYKDRENFKYGDKRPPIVLDPLELGDDGVMKNICFITFRDWLEFGVKLSVPAVRKNIITLSNKHLLSVTIKELQNIITQLSSDTTKVFSCLPLENDDNQVYDEIYLPYNSSYVPHRAILVARNFEQWKANILSNNSLQYIDIIHPQQLKHIQKFIPVVTAENYFIPRQKFLWALIESDSIIIYTYNWSKDNVDKLVEISSNIGLWLSVRASLLNSVVAQKLGIFYNQAIARTNLITSTNPYLSYISDVECMMKFSRDRPRHPLPAGNQSITMLEVFRDTYKNIRPCHNDPVVVFVVEMQELKRTDKKYKDELKKLHSMWQSRTSTCTWTQIQILKQNSRVIHFCHTPLLFLSRWRIESAATRDHSLTSSFVPNDLTDRRYCQDDVNNWHNSLCYSFISDYKRYLQSLGFLTLQIENSHKKHGLLKSESSSYNSIFYVQKTILGGILIFTICLTEPFLITKLYAIECGKLQSTTSRTSINQFTLSFLDECDKVKVAMHLHSFTYDFHLRCIHNYIANCNNVNKVCEGYHLTQFLDDFMKYYNKAPNFARNLVHEEIITIKELMTEGKQLFDYLLSNVSRYNMDVFNMRDENDQLEYVLVQVANIPQMTYKDSQDYQHTDDFDVTLVISRTVCPNETSDNTLHLKFYLILTSRTDTYPKSEIDRTLGKFRTVSYGHRSSGTKDSFTETNDVSIQSDRTDDDFHKSAPLTASQDSNCESTSQKSLVTIQSQEDKSQSFSSQTHVEIKKECVNYLGYYSSHEQLMQQLILNRASTTRNKIKDMVARGMVDCRTHLLWNKLVSCQETNHLTYGEFIELKRLANLQNLCDIHPNLNSLLNQPITWYQGLAKLLLVKYVEQNRTFISPDGNIQHYVILHPRYDGAFMLLSMDLHTSRGDVYAVYRATHKHKDSDICMSDKKALLNGFINCVCFYIWSGLI